MNDPPQDIVPAHYEEVVVDAESVDETWLRGAALSGEGTSSFLAWANRSEQLRKGVPNHRAGFEGEHTPLSPMRVSEVLPTKGRGDQPLHQEPVAQLEVQSHGVAAAENMRGGATGVESSGGSNGPSRRLTKGDDARRKYKAAAEPNQKVDKSSAFNDLFSYVHMGREEEDAKLLAPPQHQLTAASSVETVSSRLALVPPNEVVAIHAPTRSRAGAVGGAQVPNNNKPYTGDPHGFNDPRLVQQLQDRIRDRMMLEQLLVLQDEAHSSGDIITLEAASWRNIVFREAFELDTIELERLHTSSLDELLVEYTTTDFVPHVRGALAQRIEIAEAELREINEAVSAVHARTEEESQQTEDALVDLLTSIRSERRILMEQLQIAEDHRSHAFQAERDHLIDLNFLTTVVPSGRSSDISASTAVGATRSSAGSGHRKHVANPPLAGSVFPTTSTATTMMNDRAAIPRDLWVSKTLPTARRVASFRQEHPVGLEGRRDGGGNGSFRHDNDGGKRFIDAAYPMPPLREDLDEIQRAAAPKASSSLAAAFTSARDRSERALPIGVDESFNGAEKKQKSAAFYRSFLAAASPTGGPQPTTPAGRLDDNNGGGEQSVDDVIRALSKTLVDSGTAVLRQ